MRPETLELALQDWPDWRETIRRARQRTAYDQGSSYEARLAWWEAHREGVIQARCRDALTHLRLPRSFSWYWVACFLTDYQQDGNVHVDGVGVPYGWLEGVRWPQDRVPPGCQRILVGFRRYFLDGHEIQPKESSIADFVRIHPPQLVTVTIPRWIPSAAAVQGILPVRLMPRAKWRDLWKSKPELRSSLPILAEAPEGASPWHAIIPSSQSADDDLSKWVQFVMIEIPPWAMSEETSALANEQLMAYRMWRESQEVHPISKHLRSAAARISAPSKEPPEWPDWLLEYQRGEISGIDLVARVWRYRVDGPLSTNATRQPKSAKNALEWVRTRMKRDGIDPPEIPRYWWTMVDRDL